LTACSGGGRVKSAPLASSAGAWHVKRMTSRQSAAVPLASAAGAAQLAVMSGARCEPSMRPRTLASPSTSAGGSAAPCAPRLAEVVCFLPALQGGSRALWCGGGLALVKVVSAFQT